MLWFLLCAGVGFTAWDLSGNYSERALLSKKQVYEARDTLEKNVQRCEDDITCIEGAFGLYFQTTIDHYDLEAQQDMALFAMIVAVISFLQLGLSAAGIFYVARNLRQNSVSINLANKAIVVENRPWVYLETGPVRHFRSDDRGMHMQIGVRLTNTGASPAQKVHVECGAIYSGSADQLEDINNWIAKTAKRHRSEMWDRSLFNGTQMEMWPPAFYPIELHRRAEEDGSDGDLVSMAFVIGAFYTTDFDDEMRYTVSLHEVGEQTAQGGMRALQFVDGVIRPGELMIRNFNGLIIAT